MCFPPIPPEELEVGYSEAHRETPLNSWSARNRARRLRANYYLLGDGTRSGRDLIVSLRLLKSGTGREVAHAQASTDRDSLELLARRLVIRLTTDYLQKRGTPLIFTESGTPDAEVFAEYVRTSQLIRRGDFLNALDVLRANERLSYAPTVFVHAIAQAWSPQDEEQSASLAQIAYNLRGMRGPVDTLLLRGLQTSYWGVTGEPEKAFGEAETNYGSQEASYQLAEFAFLELPALGQPIDDLRNRFERLHASDATDYRSLFYLIRLSLRDGDAEHARDYAEAAQNLGPDIIQASALTCVRSLLQGDTTGFSRQVGSVARAVPDALPLTLRLVEDGWRGSPGSRAWRNGVQAVTDTMIQVKNHPRLKLVGLEARATWEYAQGRWQTGRRYVAMMPESRATRLMLEGFVAGAFGDRLPSSEVEAIRHDLWAWSPPEPRKPNPVVAARIASRDYLLSLLAARVGDLPGAQAYSSRLMALSSENRIAAWPETAKQLVPELNAGLHAAIALTAGAPREALDSLQKVVRAPMRFVVGHPLYAHQFERFLRAEASFQVGNNAEALRWYQSLIDDPGVNVFTALAHLRESQVYQRLGNPSMQEREDELFAGMAGRQESPFRWNPAPVRSRSKSGTLQAH